MLTNIGNIDKIDHLIIEVINMTENSTYNLVPTGQAVKILGVSTSTLYRMIEKEILTPVKTPGGQRRFKVEELLTYLQASKSIVAPQNPSKLKNLNTIPQSGEVASDAIEMKIIESSKNISIVDPRNKLNNLTGKEWLPVTKSFFFQKGLGSSHQHAQIERQHPAPYSFQDISKLVLFFTQKGQRVLDPFGGVGSTAKACEINSRFSTSIELSEKWNNLAIERLEKEVGVGTSSNHEFINEDCRNVLKSMQPDSFDFMVTSPPYWAILNKKADHKVKNGRVNNNLATNYSDDGNDLGNIPDYEKFLEVLVKDVFLECGRVLKQGKYMCIVVSDFRNKSDFISFHSDLIQRLNKAYVDSKNQLRLQGVKILAQNHKSLLPYGYPFAYVENIHHQYILIFRKDKSKK